MQIRARLLSRPALGAVASRPILSGKFSLYSIEKKISCSLPFTANTVLKSVEHLLTRATTDSNITPTLH